MWKNTIINKKRLGLAHFTKDYDTGLLVSPFRAKYRLCFCKYVPSAFFSSQIISWVAEQKCSGRYFKINKKKHFNKTLWWSILVTVVIFIGPFPSSLSLLFFWIRTSGVGIKSSTNWATITALLFLSLLWRYKLYHSDHLSPS